MAPPEPRPSLHIPSLMPKSVTHHRHTGWAASEPPWDDLFHVKPCHVSHINFCSSQVMLLCFVFTEIQRQRESDLSFAYDTDHYVQCCYKLLLQSQLNLKRKVISICIRLKKRYLFEEEFQSHQRSSSAQDWGSEVIFMATDTSNFTVHRFE